MTNAAPTIPRPSAAEEGTTLSPSALVVFGATGDLARRKLFPAVYNLAHDGLLPRGFRLIGSSRSALSDEEFRARVADAVRRFSSRAPDEPTLAGLLEGFHFVPGHSDEDSLHRGLARRLDELDAEANLPANRLFYLSTAPELFSPIVECLGRQRLQRHDGAAVRVLIEKPFGRSAAEARAFNATVLSVFEESQVYRIDHYLGKEEVQNILALRFANPIFEPFWNAATITGVQLTAAEQVGVGGRAAYYEESGALRDHVQNHMLQLLSMICMEPPADLSADAVRDEKVRVLRAVEAPAAGDLVRAQYGPGLIRGEAVPGYLEEAGVATDSRTETYAALRLSVDTPRWAGVPFLLRTGKRLAEKRTEIAIRLRPTPLSAFLAGVEVGESDHHLIIDLQASGSVGISLATKVPGLGMRAQPAMVRLPGPPADRHAHDAYERLLLDGLRGDPTLFTRSDEIDEQWRICDQVLGLWSAGGGPLAQYPAGSQGPAEAAGIAAPGNPWRSL